MDVVLFDVDGTLVDHELAAKQAMATLVALHPDATRGRPLVWARATWHRLRETWRPHSLTGAVTREQEHVERVRGLWIAAGADPPDPEQSLAIFAEYRAAYEDALQVHADTHACLDRLRGAVRLGIVTDGGAVLQRRRLVRCGIASRFEIVVTSEEVGAVKPDPRLFLAAADAFGVPPARCTHVGDRLEVDALAAARVGMVGVWVDRHDTGRRVDGERVRRIASLDELDASGPVTGASVADR